MKISVFGCGYVGLSNSVLLARKNDVMCVDISEEKVNKINNHVSPIKDAEIEHYLSSGELNLWATTKRESAINKRDFIIIATPTDYDPRTNYFNTDSVEEIISFVRESDKEVPIVIRSTIPLGFVERKRAEGFRNVFFVPEFLREGRALYDNLYPSRIVIGDTSTQAKRFANLLVEASYKKDVKVLFTGCDEAEAIKLFANTFLAMRVAFFNELDSYAYKENLSSEQIIEGITLDPRIGLGYCNPSFGYGGYCLPKDTKQLLANFKTIPQTLIRAIVESNRVRKDFIVDEIINLKPKIVGIYRLVMKNDSDNFRASAIQGIIRRLNEKGVEVIVYEPLYNEEYFYGNKVFKLFDTFKEKADLIVANRMSEQLKSVSNKVFTRDVFGSN